MGRGPLPGGEQASNAGSCRHVRAFRTFIDPAAVGLPGWEFETPLGPPTALGAHAPFGQIGRQVQG